MMMMIIIIIQKIAPKAESVLPNMVFPLIWGKKWLCSEHAHASYPGLSFRPPGFSPYGGGGGAGRKESSGTGL